MTLTINSKKENVMDIIYRVTYLPHINTDKPKYYIGSKKNWDKRPKYRGSSASNQIFEYTEGMTLAEWWSKEQRRNIENFKIEILEEFDNIPPKDLLEVENRYHVLFDVLSDEYFNKSIATIGFCPSKNSEDTKRKKSEATKKYWDSQEGIEKRKRLSERNKKTKSEEMIDRWKEPTESMLSRKMPGRPKGAKDLGKRKPKKRRIPVFVDGIQFESLTEASNFHSVSNQKIMRRCLDPNEINCYIMEK